MIKSVLITGANAGLGKECARQLASLGQAVRAPRLRLIDPTLPEL